jgi:excisionase family DNA binding protein
MLDANVTVREAAVRLGVTLTHVYNMVRAERLPGAFKTDGVWQVPQATVNAYLKKRQQRLTSTPRNEQSSVAA